MHRILKSFLKRLTNLTVSNRSLLLLKLSEEQDLDLNELDYLNGKPSFSIIDQLLSGKKNISLCPESDSRNVAINQLSSRLKKIARREKFIFEERGSKDLYVGWPFVKGKLADGTPVRCPLLFFPVTITLEERQWKLELREDIPVGFNKSFLLAYSHYNEIQLNDEFIDTSFEDFDSDSQVFRTELYSLLKESSIELNFNQDLFVNKLVSFENYKKADYEEKFGIGELKLFSEAVLGIFPQSGSYLVPDYDYLLKNNLAPDLEKFFYKRSGHLEETEPSINPSAVVKEEHTITPFALDASQEKAIISVKKGKSLVVQGPPGTGKSQLICNLIADYISRGKNVLLVCQKRAALDVVYNRLKKKEIQDFVGLIHDFKNDRNQLYAQINSQIEKLDEYKFRNNSLDAINIERSFVHVCRRIEQLTEELEEFRTALFDEGECGISVKELYLTTDPSLKQIDLKQEYRYFKSNEIQNFVRALKTLLPYGLRFEKIDFVWKDRISFEDLSVNDKSALLELLDHIPFFQSTLTENIRELIGATLEMEDLEWILGRKEQIQQMLHLLEDVNVYSNFVFILNKNTDQDWLTIREKQITECFKGSGIENTLPTEQLGQFQKVLENATQARRNIFKYIKWSWFSKEKYLLKRVVVGNGLKWSKEGIEQIVQRIDNRMNLEHQLTEMKQSGWLKDVPDERNFEIISTWFHHQQTALAAKEILKELRSLKDYLNIPALSYVELRSKLSSLIEVISDIPEEKKNWLRFLTPRQISKILTAFDYSLELAEVLTTDFEHLVQYDAVRSKLLSHERAVFEKLIKESNKEDVGTLIGLFENSVKLEWIESIEMKYPILRSVSSLKMEQMEKELQECVSQKEQLSSDILLMKAREKTYSELEYNRLENLITYRDLNHQVTKKKKIWPIRKLLSNHGSEIFKLIPCWLASPESVSSVFPMDVDFDLVIFDEASQCYAENGIPSLYRGRQVVITGDSKQLAPSDLYSVRWEEDDDVPELEVESLLDLGRQYLSQVQLTGHYRSKSLDLIEFSNIHFYNHKLSVLPQFDDANSSEPSLKYIKVNGVWKNNVNEAEAEEVVKLVKELKKKDPTKSVGVVTFNYKQQLLIQDLLEDTMGSLDPEKYFVKNIENVQGDERDVIVFSIGYAPNASGKLIMNFGSLSMDKGENRLNVAVTRARESIYLVTSINPEELDVSNVKNEGPKLLKKYLEFGRAVSTKKYKAILPHPEGRRLDWYLKNRLEDCELSFKVVRELPFADLSIKDNALYKGLIQTDDDLYYQYLSVKEAHAYLPLSLQKKNWRYKKIYSRMFWENKQGVKETLIKAFGNNA